MSSSNVNTTPELRIFILTRFLRFSRRFPQINVGGDSAHFSSFGKRTREPRPRLPTKGTLRQNPKQNQPSPQTNPSLQAKTSLIRLHSFSVFFFHFFGT